MDTEGGWHGGGWNGGAGAALGLGLGLGLLGGALATAPYYAAPYYAAPGYGYAPAAENIGRRALVDLAVVGDVRTTIEALLPLLQQNWDAPHLAQAREHYTRARKALDELAVGTNPRSP